MLCCNSLEAERKGKEWEWLVKGQESSLPTDLPSSCSEDGHGLREKEEEPPPRC